jgi:hypothetical protein
MLPTLLFRGVGGPNDANKSDGSNIYDVVRANCSDYEFSDIVNIAFKNLIIIA